MLISAFIVLACAALLGSFLAILHARDRGTVPWLPGALHGLAGLIGLGGLMLALQGPPRGLDQGTGSFGLAGAVLFALAAVAGLAILLRYRLQRRPAGSLIGLHATLAISGLAILLAYVMA